MTALFATEEAIKTIRKISNTLIHTPRYQRYLKNVRSEQKVYYVGNKSQKSQKECKCDEEGATAMQKVQMKNNRDNRRWTRKYNWS